MTHSGFGSQLLTYHTICIYVKLHGYPPTKEELATMRHMHITNVYTHLRQLEARGLITRETGWRNIRLPARAS